MLAATGLLLTPHSAKAQEAAEQDGEAEAPDSEAPDSEADDEASGDGLDVIVVTAERRSSSLQKVPLAISAVGGDSIREGEVTGISDIAQRVPSTNFSSFNIGEPQIFIRGIGNTSDSIGSDPAVGVFLDDVYISRAGAAAFDLFDIERVEVLRGPQGTLYGKNVIGGAISVLTKKPSFTFEGKASATIGNLDARTLQAYVNGPLSETLAGKLVLSRRVRDGYAVNVINGQDYEDVNNFGVRAQVLFEPSDSFNFLLGADYSRDKGNGNCRTLVKLEPEIQSGLGITYAQGEGAKQRDAGAESVRRCAFDTVQTANRTLYGVMGRAEADFGWGKLTSITAYRSSEFDWIQDLGAGNAPPRLFSLVDSAEEQANQFSQEIRLSGVTDFGLDWVTGVFYLRESAERSENFKDFYNFPAFAPFNGDVTFYQDGTVNSFAAFTDLKYTITDSLTLAAGLRYSHDKKSIAQSAVDNVMDGSPAAIPLGPGRPYSAVGRDSWGQFTPRVALNWEAGDDIRFYASYSRGFKSGAFASQATSADIASRALEPEKADSFEVGMKSEWFDNHLRFNANLFAMNYTNLQVFSLINLQLVTANARKATNKGIELEAQAVLSPNFRVYGNFTAMDPVYDDYVVTNPNTGTTEDHSGNILARAPKTSWSAGASWLIPLGGTAGQLELAGNMNYTGDFYFDPANDPRSLVDAHTVLGGSLAYRTDNEKFEVRLWVKNLTDKEYPVHSNNSTFGGATRIFAAPRTFGATVSREF